MLAAVRCLHPTDNSIGHKIGVGLLTDLQCNENESGREAMDWQFMNRMMRESGRRTVSTTQT